MPDDTELLAVLGEHQRIGAIGPVPLADAVAHSRRFVSSVPESATTLIDLGAGGGLPGLVIAWDLPALAVTLVDRRQRRTDALRRSVARLGWSDRVRVLAGDIVDIGQDPGHRHQYEVVTARSFGPPKVTLTGALAFVRPGGTILISEAPGGNQWLDLARDLGGSVSWCGSAGGIARFVTEAETPVVPSDHGRHP